MPTALGHTIVGLGMGAAAVSRHRLLGVNGTVLSLLVVTSVLPDLDVIAFAMGIPYHHPLGHRGFFHSGLFAVMGGLLFWLWCFHSSRRFEGRAVGMRELAVFMAVGLSHPLLDMLTDGGLGIAFFSPLSQERFFFPVQPIPVSPIGFSPRVVPILAWEAKLFVPFAAALWMARWIVDRRERL